MIPDIELACASAAIRAVKPPDPENPMLAIRIAGTRRRLCAQRGLACAWQVAFPARRGHTSSRLHTPLGALQDTLDRHPYTAGPSTPMLLRCLLERSDFRHTVYPNCKLQSLTGQAENRTPTVRTDSTSTPNSPPRPSAPNLAPCQPESRQASKTTSS